MQSILAITLLSIAVIYVAAKLSFYHTILRNNTHYVTSASLYHRPSINPSVVVYRLSINPSVMRQVQLILAITLLPIAVVYTAVEPFF